MAKENISIVTVSYRSAETISGTLDCVAAQQGLPDQHLVQDGQSDDGTADIVAKYDHATFVSEPDDGIYDALNKGIAHCSGDIIGLLHADDFYPNPEVLKKVSKRFEADPSLMGVYGDLKYVARDNTDKVVRYWKAGRFKPYKLHLGWMPPHPTLFLRREAYEKTGGFDTRYRISADYDFILRLFQTFGDKIDYLPEVLVHMRTGGVSNTGVPNLVKKSKEDFWIASRMGYFAPLIILLKMASKVKQFRNILR
jgi:glycosyltransferase involved in cell wall biosynthesis